MFSLVGTTPFPGTSDTSIEDWWDGGLSDSHANLSSFLIYVMWNAWKERNRRIFYGKRMTYIEVAHMDYEDIL